MEKNWILMCFVNLGAEIKDGINGACGG